MTGRVLIVLGGDRPEPGRLAAWIQSASLVVAADSGADRVLEAGGIPDVLIGDLDSASALAREKARKAIQIEDQGSTDCDKALAYVASLGAGSVVLANVEGGLPDHHLATLHSAAKAPIDAILAFERGLGHALVGPREITYRTRADARVSFLPIEPCQGVDLQGVEWELRQAEMRPLGATSISNRAVGDRVRISLHSGAGLVFIETDGLPNWDFGGDFA